MKSRKVLEDPEEIAKLCIVAFIFFFPKRNVSSEWVLFMLLLESCFCNKQLVCFFYTEFYTSIFISDFIHVLTNSRKKFSLEES